MVVAVVPRAYPGAFPRDSHAVPTIATKAASCGRQSRKGSELTIIGPKWMKLFESSASGICVSETTKTARLQFAATEYTASTKIEHPAWDPSVALFYRQVAHLSAQFKVLRMSGMRVCPFCSATLCSVRLKHSGANIYLAPEG